MPLFQQSVLKKYISDLNKENLHEAWVLFKSHFHNTAIQENIRDAKEEEYQEGFVRDLFVNILGYTLKPQPNYNFVLEKKTETDATKSDGALLKADTIIGVVELKDTGTTELDKIEKQVFGYKHKHKNCVYVITSNFEKLRFYINDATDYEEFNLFTITLERFSVLFLCLHQQYIQNDIPLKMKQASLMEEENVTKKLYADYSSFKKQLFNNITALNPGYDKLELFKKTQKLLDRFLFILFAEDRLLLPPNSVREIMNQWEQLKELDNYVPLYDRFKKYFGYLNTGYEGKQYEIFAYNGGLFAADEILDTIKIDDQLLYNGGKALSNYDFESEVDVNILGHIFEHSLGEIEEVQAQLEGNTIDKTKTRRKKDGVFYTPRYITKYIVESTVGELCRLKKEELSISEQEFAPVKRKANRKQLLDKIEIYRNWLLQLTICDPACGSGAFLNQALEFLITEHRHVDELKAKLFGDTLVLTDIENAILENNLFGVDINEEAVEIARLSLWLRTAKKGRKLSNLNANIKCGNSLIDDPAVAGDNAFNWQKEFPQVFGPYIEPVVKTKTVEAIKVAGSGIKQECIESSIDITEQSENYAVTKDKIVNTDLRITNDDIGIVNEPAGEYGNNNQSKKGFDVIIGNPPYVDIKALPKEITAYLFANFETSNNRINLFSIFIERSFSILKTKGLFSFIIPSSILTQESYKKIRELLLDKTSIKSIVRLPNESFGGGAGEVKVDTIILTFQNLTGLVSSTTEILVYKGFNRINEISGNNATEYTTLNQSKWDNDESKIFRINVDNKISQVISQIESNTERLADCAYFSLGLTPYDKYRGHTPEQIESRAFHSNIKKDETYKKLLAGNDVRRYFVEWGGDEWISYGTWLGAAREKKFFSDKRILVKQIIDWSDKRIWAALTNEEIYNTQNAFNLIAKDDYHPEYLIALLNSRLFSFYLRKKFLEEYKDRFQKILIKDSKEFPIKSIPENEQNNFVEKVSTIISKTKDLQQLKKQFLKLLQSKLDNLTISKKLEDWPSLTFNEFSKELTKQKIKLSLSDEAEWLLYFEQQKNNAIAIQQQVNNTDNEIDRLVYSLYKLTEDEIRLIEKS